MTLVKRISVRLDAESHEALSALQNRSGLDRSGAIRFALIEAAQRRRGASLAAEAETLAAEAASLCADPVDRAEVAQVRLSLDSLRAVS